MAQRNVMFVMEPALTNAPAAMAAELFMEKPVRNATASAPYRVTPAAEEGSLTNNPYPSFFTYQGA